MKVRYIFSLLQKILNTGLSFLLAFLFNIIYNKIRFAGNNGGFMRRLRDVFYINANFEENYFVYYGMEFYEFVRHCPIPIENLLIVEGEYVAEHFNNNWYFETANGQEEISELAQQDIYSLGNFHWIDYNSEENLNSCTPEERAEVLYLSHFCKPLKTPFFDRIQNNFVYLAHDDGWYCKLYCRDMPVFADIIANKITASISANTRRKIYPMDAETKTKILELTKEGLLIDFTSIYKENKRTGLLFYTIGRFQDMDEMYNNLEKHKQNASHRGSIEQCNKVWKIETA